MRTRTILLVVAILLVAGFAALNWPEIVRSTPLSFGLMVTDAPLGLILLGLLGLTLVLFLASSAAIRTQSLMDYRAHQKDLEAQRELADKAEASRFIELRQHMESHLKDMRDRDAIAATEFDKAMMQSRRELQSQMELMNRMIASRLNEIEQKLDTRLGRRPDLVGGPMTGAPMRQEPVPPLTERAMAQDREAQLREEERLRDERIREEREMRREERAADKPAESGWRKWF